MSINLTRPVAAESLPARAWRAARFPPWLVVGLLCLAVARLADAVLKHERGGHRR